MILPVIFNYEGYEGEEVDKDEYWVGVLCEDKGQRDGGEDKGGKKQEDGKRGGVLFPGCGR